MLPFLADWPPSYFVVLASVFGLAFGSFLNVVIQRVPLGQNLALPASHCPACARPLTWRDNLPLVSFALLRGRCRHCAAPIAWRYPLVEALTALMWAGIAQHSGASWQALWHMGLTLFLIPLAVIDAEHHLLPDVLTYPLLLFAVVATVAQKAASGSLASDVSFDIFFADPSADFSRAQAAWRGALLIAAAAPCLLALDWLDDKLFARYFPENEDDEGGEDTDIIEDKTAWALLEENCARQRQTVIVAALIVSCVLAGAWAAWMIWPRTTTTLTLQRAYEGLTDTAFGALVAAGVFWFLRACYFFARKAEGMGLGDVKMMAGIGAFAGWITSFAVMLYGSLLGAAIALLFAFQRKQGWQTPLPFGTCLAVAALILLLRF